MKPWQIIVAGLICVLLSSACRKSSNNSARPVAPVQVGATYILNDGEGGFRAAKVLVVVEGEIVFVQLFGERWKEQPSVTEIHKVHNSTALAYSPASFAGMQPVQLENGVVSPEELAAYEAWKMTNRDVF